MKTEPIGIRFTPEERAALERAAQADERSMSALGRKVILEWLRKGGWLEKEHAATGRLSGNGE